MPTPEDSPEAAIGVAQQPAGVEVQVRLLDPDVPDGAEAAAAALGLA